MTKFILVGGADTSASTDQKSALANEINIGFGDSIKILSVLFAQPRENWEQHYQSRKEYFKELFNSRHQLEMANPRNFEGQVKWADVVYIHGGDETLLAYWLNQYDLIALSSEKVVVGSSAGAEYLSKKFNTCDWREIKNGKGLIDVNVIVHYESEYGLDDPRGSIDWGKMKLDLKKFDPHAKLHCLREGEFAVLEK